MLIPFTLDTRTGSALYLGQLETKSDDWTCWFDYIGRSEEERAQLFGEEFRQRYQRRVVETGSRQAFEPIPGWRDQDLSGLDPTVRSKLVRAFRGADSIGVPYDFYCRQALGKRMQVNRMPMVPSLDYIAQDRMRGFVLQRWEESLKQPLILPAPRPASDYGVRFYVYLQKCAYYVPGRHWFISGLLKRKYLTVAEARVLFGDKWTDRALTETGTFRVAP